MSGSSPSPSSSTAKRWQDIALPSFLIQQLVSTGGTMVVGVFAAIVPAALVAAVTKNTSGGNWADHLGEQPILRAVAEPYFFFPVMTGFVFGVVSHRYSRSSSAAWVWVLPTMI